MVINVMPRNSLDYEEAVKKFWKAECAVNRDDSPAFFNSGGPKETKDEGFNKDNDYFYLSWSVLPKCHIDGAPILRECDVPSGKGLLIPIVSVIVSDKERPGASNSKLNELVVIDQEYVQKGPGPFVELDGDPHDLTGFEVTTGVFPVTYPDNGPPIWNSPNNPNAPISNGESNAIAGGHYLITSPPSAGSHTVHFGGAVLIPGNVDCIENHYEENVEYTLNVH